MDYTPLRLTEPLHGSRYRAAVLDGLRWRSSRSQLIFDLRDINGRVKLPCPQVASATKTAAVSKLQDPNLGRAPRRVKTQSCLVEVEEDVLNNVFGFATIAQYLKGYAKDQSSVSLIQHSDRVRMGMFEMRE